MGQEQLKVVEGAVLHAQGAQSTAINLGGQIFQQQPGGLLRHVGAVAPPVADVGAADTARPAAAAAGHFVGSWSHAPQILTHRGEIV